MRQDGVKNKLLELLAGVSAWEQLEKKIAQLPTKKEKGDCFELFVKCLLTLSLEYHLEKVWLLNETPGKYIEKLGQRMGQDFGIDIIATTDEGTLWAIQAKFRSKRNKVLSYRELSTALASSDKADYRLIATNTIKLPSIIQDRKNVGQLLVDRFDLLDEDFFRRLKDYLELSRIELPEKKIPRHYQREIINKAKIYFKNNIRGKIILPPGTGKTLLGLWIYEALKAKKVLVMVPSLALLRQTLEEWSKNTKEQFHFICIGSDTTIVKGDIDEDSAVGYKWELDIPVTTKSIKLKEFLIDNEKQLKVVFTTYQSSKVLTEAVKELYYKFDLVIYDEAHRTAQLGNSLFNITLNDNNLYAKKRLFFTATPRLYADNIKTRSVNQEVNIFSMDDRNLYGEEIYRMSFKEAIKLKCLTDYKIVVIVVTDDDIRELLKSDELIYLDSEEQKHGDFIETLANKIALLKAMNKYNAKHFFSFHCRIQRAKKFIDKEGYSLDKNFTLILKKPKNIFFYSHVNGEMTTAERENILNEFKMADYGVVSNARCLSEGVNVPAVDGVYFIDPKYSKIEIIQSVGRALRIYKGKKFGYIVVPVFLRPDEMDNIDKIANKTKFGIVWNVIAAMQSQDKNLDDLIIKARIQNAEMSGLINIANKSFYETLEKLKEKIEVVDIPKHINKNAFINNLHLQIIDRRTSNWYFMYGLLKAYALSHTYPFPKSNEYYQGYNLCAWCSRQRVLRHNNKLDSEKVVLLNKIGFIWGKKKKYKKHKKNKSIPKKEVDQKVIDNLITKGRLRGFITQTEILNTLPELEEYLDTYELLIDEFDKYGVQVVEASREAPSTDVDKRLINKDRQKEVKKNTKAIVPLSFKEESNNEMTSICLKQLINSKSPRAKEFIFYYPILKDYRKANSNNWPNKRERYKGTELGEWLFNVYKAKKNKSLLLQEKILLDEVGLKWNKDMVYNKETIKLLQEYRKDNPNGWPEKNVRYMGYNLYDWCLLTCYKKRKGKLDKEIEEKLNRINFPWNKYKL